MKNWKKRWFVLEWPELRYYKAPGDKVPRGVVICSEVTLSDKLARERTGAQTRPGHQPPVAHAPVPCTRRR